MVCMAATSFVVTAQIPELPISNKSEIRNFIEKSSKNYHGHKHKAKINQLTGLNIHYWNGSTWDVDIKAVMEYDGELLTSRTVNAWTGNEWIPSERKTLSYNSNGLLISEVYEELDEMGELSPMERYLYEYDMNSNTPIYSEIIYQYFDGENWINDYMDTFEVSNNMISAGTSFVWDENEWLEESYFTVMEENDTTVITYQSWMGSEWENMEREIYPNLSIEELYQWSFNQSVLLEVPFFLMNLQLPDYIFQEWDGEGWVNTQMQYTSDYETPNQLPESRYVNTNYWNGEEWTPGSALKLYFNEKVNPDSSELSYFDHLYGTFDWYIYMKESYFYNDAGLYSQVIGRIDTSALGMGGTEGYENFYKYEFEWNGVTTGNENSEKPSIVKLNPAYPNPFNPATNITFKLEKAGAVSVKVYNMLGQHVATLVDGFRSAGEHAIQFEAAALSSGIYLVRMETAGYLKTQKVTLLK